MKPALMLVAPRSEDDATLVVAARGGDRAAFGCLYQRYAGLIHGLLLAQVPHAEAEDLTQEVFLQAMRRLSGLRDPAAVGPWLAAIARHRATDRHRARRPETSTETAQMPEASVMQAPTGEARAILLALQQLPLAYRETLILRLLEGMTGPEIAARTGMTSESVRVNLHRGMKKLRERLEGPAHEPAQEGEGA